MMTCVELALTAQLICFSNQTFVCTDNGSVAQAPAPIRANLTMTGDEFQADAMWQFR